MIRLKNTIDAELRPRVVWCDASELVKLVRTMTGQYRVYAVTTGAAVSRDDLRKLREALNRCL